MSIEVFSLYNIIHNLTSENYDIINEKIAKGINYTKEKYNEFKEHNSNDIEFYKNTDAYIYELINWEDDPYKKELAIFIGKHFTKNINILDFGAGIGTLINNFVENGFFNVDGVEINYFNRQFIIERFKNKKNLNINVYESISESKKNYHIVTCLHVLEHVENPFNTLKDINKKMEINGLFFGVAPFSLVGEDFPEHKIEFKNLKLENLLKSSGFEVTDVIPFGGYNTYTFELVIGRKIKEV